MDSLQDALPRRHRLRRPPAQAGDRRRGERHAEIMGDGAIGARCPEDGAALHLNGRGLGSGG